MDKDTDTNQIQQDNSKSTADLAAKVKYGIKWQAIISLASQGLYLINGIVLARILGPKEFGIYSMAQIVSAFVWMFWNLGMDSALIQKKDIDDRHLHTAFIINIIMGFSVFFAIWFLAPAIAVFFKEPAVTILVRIIAFTFIIYAFDRVPSALLGRNLKFKEAAFPEFLNAIIYPLVAIPLALLGFGAKSFAWGVLAGTAGMSITRYYWLFRYFKWRPRRLMLDLKCAKDLFRFGIFMTLSGILNFFFKNLQRIVTGKYLGAEDLGYLNKAANLTYLPISKVYSVIVGILFPTFSRLQGNLKKTRDWFRKMNFFNYVLITPALMFFIFFPDIFIGFVFGNKWLPSSTLLSIISVFSLIGLSSIYLTNIINANGFSYATFYINLIRFFLFIILLFVGIKYGLLGIVIALFIDSLIFMIFLLILSRTYVGLHIKDYFISIFEPVMVSLLSAIPVFLVRAFFLESFGYAPLFFITGTLFTILFGSYYLYRWFKKSYIEYLGFDLKELIKSGIGKL